MISVFAIVICSMVAGAAAESRQFMLFAIEMILIALNAFAIWKRLDG